MTDAVLNEQEQDAAYEAEFDKQVAAREAEKAGTAPDVTDPDKKADAPAPDATESPTEVVKEPAKEAPAEPAWIAALPESERDGVKATLAAAAEATAKAAKLELDNRSLAGRISAYQRRYEEAAGKRPAEVVKQATADQSAEWTQFKEDYPDIAKAIEGRVPATAGADPNLAAVVEFVESEKRERFLHDAWDAVETVHPGWRKIGVTPEFQTWKASSPTYEKLASSDDIADAVALFDLYKATSPTPASNPARDAAASALASKRDAQLEGGKAASSKAESPNHGVDLNDADQLFQFYADKANKRMKGRNA